MKAHTESLLSAFVHLLLICSIVKSEVFTAVVDLEPLLHTQEEIVKGLRNYLVAEEERLKYVRWLAKEYEKLYETANKDSEKFLSNPVNAYLLLKRLTIDWEITNRLIDGVHGKALIEDIQQKNLTFPDEEDLTGASAALLRLQDVYVLNTARLAEGEIAGTKVVSSKLSAGDCFELGLVAHTLERHNRAVQWMQQAFLKLAREELETADRREILEYAADSSFKIGNIRQAIKLTKDLISIAPDHPRAYENLIRFQNNLLDEDQDDDVQSPYWDPQQDAIPPADSHYEKLCRGQNTRTALEESQLYCRYTTNNSSYLLLQPAKEEVLSLNPRVVTYHDVISNKDLELFKELSLPRLARALVGNPKSGALQTANTRISKNAWLNETDHPRVKHASLMIKEITGLETDTAERLHLINYGIGGFYMAHFDFKKEGDADAFAHLGTGNRIATWIYYLSDVYAGGSTVFPLIGVEVKPEKGSAAFWYNLKKNGDGDMNTLHAACPVLAGSKWVANKWLHEKGQEFRRRCSLDPSE